MPEFLLPDLGEGLEEAEVVAWLVQVGDRVAVDQPVVEVETAKATVEVPVPFAGVVSTLHAEPGTAVAVGAPLISVAAEVDRPAGLSEPGVVIPVNAREPDVVTPHSTDEGSGNVLIGYGTSEAPRRSRRRSRRGQAPAKRKDARSAETVGPSVDLARPDGSDGVRVISPLVRKLARDAGLDLRTVVGTGHSGLLRRSDVEAALSTREVGTSPSTAAPAATMSGATSRDQGTGETRIPIRGARKVVAEKLSRSRREIPEATVWVDVDATEFLATRSVLNARTAESPISLLGLLARFTVLGLRRFPELNARIEGDEVVLPEHVHLGFAAQTDRGLVVPVVRDAHRLSTRELGTALAERTAAARAGDLSPRDLTGGTFTVNNYGVFGVDGSAAIINHPEVAILGMGRIIDRPWVVDGALAVRKVSQLTLAFDHRACDGGTAGGFLRYVADCIESPLIALGDI